MPPLKHKFSGFMLVVEKKSNVSVVVVSYKFISCCSVFSQKFMKKIVQDHSISTFGVFTLSHGDTLAKITCANMVTHTTTTPKSEIQVTFFYIQLLEGRHHV